MTEMPAHSSQSALVLSSRRIRLRPLSDRDRPFLFHLMTSPEAGGRVRFGGATPSPEKVFASLWESVLAQFIVEGTSSGESVGLVAITSPNFRDSFAYISALASPPAQQRGLVVEATLLAFHYAFTNWPFRKIYMEATETSYGAFRSGLDVYFKEEGRLKQHSFWNGRYVDAVILAVYRETWEREAQRFVRLLGGHASRVSMSAG